MMMKMIFLFISTGKCKLFLMMLIIFSLLLKQFNTALKDENPSSYSAPPKSPPTARKRSHETSETSDDNLSPTPISSRSVSDDGATSHNNNNGRSAFGSGIHSFSHPALDRFVVAFKSKFHVHTSPQLRFAINLYQCLSMAPVALAFLEIHYIIINECHSSLILPLCNWGANLIISILIICTSFPEIKNPFSSGFNDVSVFLWMKDLFLIYASLFFAGHVVILSDLLDTSRNYCEVNSSYLYWSGLIICMVIIVVEKRILYILPSFLGIYIVYSIYITDRV